MEETEKAEEKPKEADDTMMIKEGDDSMMIKEGATNKPSKCAHLGFKRNLKSASSSSSSQVCESCKKTVCDKCLFTKLVYLNCNSEPSPICKKCEVLLVPIFSEIPILDNMLMPPHDSNDYLFFAMVHFLRGINYNCSRVLLKEHIKNGYKHAHHVMSGGHFKNLQEVSEFSWFILAKSAAKGSGFVNGALQIEDPDGYLFNALSPYGYSRKINSSMIDYCERNGYDKDRDEPIFLCNGKFEKGYSQFGIDVIKSKCPELNLGLIGAKKHILVGKIPTKVNSGSYIFFKIEKHGTNEITDQFNHAKDLIGFYMSSKMEACKSRRETDYKSHIQFFKKTLKLIEKWNSAIPFILPKPFSYKRYKEKAQIIGISYMYRKIKDFYYILKLLPIPSPTNSVLYYEVKKTCKDFIKSIVEDVNLDHIEARFGSEVILNLDELLCKGIRKSTVFVRRSNSF